MGLAGKKIAVYLTGGIANYKATILIRKLIKAGAVVRVGMTDAATQFISPLTLATLSQNPVLTTFTAAEKQQVFIPHIEIAQWADYSLVVPATANIIGKMVNGIADDLVSSALMATSHSKFVVPAMNDAMWNNPAVKRNIARLIEDGVTMLEPASGMLAEGYVAKGRMPEPDEIYTWFTSKIEADLPLKGKKILITTGGTQEPIDAVRYIGNRSSGKMGIALAETAVSMGADVTLIAGMTTVSLPSNVQVVRIKTFSELQHELETHFDDCDGLIMAAAVSDYHVAKPAGQKIKAKKHDTVELKLVRNPNLLEKLGKQAHHQLLVGFAAETDDLLANATAELAAKNVDMIVANDVSRNDIGFGSDLNEGYLLKPNHQPIRITKTDKKDFARQVMLEVQKMLCQK